MKKRAFIALNFILLALFLSGCETDIAEKIGDKLTDVLADMVDANVWEESPTTADTQDPAMPGAGTPGRGDSVPGPAYMGGEPTDEEIEGLTTGMLRYSYSKLNEKERSLYREIYSVLYNHTDGVSLASTDADEVDRVFQLVMNDHPEIFYVTGYSMNKYMLGEMTMSIEFNGTYDKTADEVKKARGEIAAYVRRLKAEMPEYDSDYDKVKYVYEYLIDNTEYDLKAEDNQNILSVFSTGRTVCQGYAKATQYLLNEMGIPCLLISGVVKGGEPHSWNLARVDGTWTYIDTTWGDASYRNISTGEEWNEISYDYLCVGEDELFGTHHVNSLIELPKAEKKHLH
ncbi:MAG: hypothetical protein IKR68_00520 [Lachnospiraceae bacterium]|nr:hypothetical protein [Lachnospiraceae bacterium]